MRLWGAPAPRLLPQSLSRTSRPPAEHRTVRWICPLERVPDGDFLTTSQLVSLFVPDAPSAEALSTLDSSHFFTPTQEVDSTGPPVISPCLNKVSERRGSVLQPSWDLRSHSSSKLSAVRPECPICGKVRKLGIGRVRGWTGRDEATDASFFCRCFPPCPAWRPTCAGVMETEQLCHQLTSDPKR